MDISELRIESFLKLGYFIDYAGRRRPIDFSAVDKELYRDADQAALVTIGITKLRETFVSEFELGKDHVVPLSGGLDSRLILGALLEFTEASNLQTYTFGVPGSYDYELGCSVAKAIGTHHMAYPLSKIPYHEDDLLDFARRSDCQALLFLHPPIWELDRRYNGALIWSGFVGDLVAGSFVRHNPSTTLDQAKRQYLRSRVYVRSTKLHRCTDEDFLPHVTSETVDPNVLTFDEQVLWGEGVRKFTEPLVLFTGPIYKTPLINTPWMDFLLSVPNAYRANEELMIEIARASFPTLFSLPSKNSLGRSPPISPHRFAVGRIENKVRKALHQFIPSVNYPHTMYNDFNEGIRNDKRLRELVLANIAALKERQLVHWINIDQLASRHMSRLRNHGDALLTLASLELVLRANATA